jgi:hypothetical protein
MRRQRIPQTDSIRELVKFWDTHDVTDFDDELEELTEPVFEPKRGAVVEVHLKPHEAAALKRLAESKDMAPADLIEEWVRQKVS